MLISVQTGYLPEKIGIDATFKAIKEAGFEAVDYNMVGFHSWDEQRSGKESEMFTNEEKLWAYVEEVKKSSEKYGVKIGQMHAPTPSFFKDSEKGTEIMRRDIAKCIEIAGYLNCPHIVVHPSFDGSARYPMPHEREVEENYKMYTSFIPYLKKYHVTCCLENMWSQDWGTKKIYTACCSDMNEACEYIDKFNEIAGEKCFAFCLDVGHLILLGLDPCYSIEKLGSRLEALHIHDNDGVTDGHTAPYTGCVNWERFLLGLKNVGYTGNLSFETEYFPKKFPDELLVPSLRLLADTAEYFRKRLQQ